MVRVKICGITREVDARVAADAGADAIGLVFAKSPRQVSVSQARKIVAVLPPFVSAIGVFVNESPARIRRIAEEVGLSGVQLHGDESPHDVTRLRPLKIIKAIRVRDAGFIEQVKDYARAGISAILLDTYERARYGGTGSALDWGMVAKVLKMSKKESPPIILAGGLTSRSVAQAIRIVRPWGVDVSSGVETRPGIKSAIMIKAFVAQARRP